MSREMQIVIAVGGDGGERQLALLRAEGGVAFVCAPENYARIIDGRREPPMVGYPIEFVRWAETGEPVETSDGELEVSSERD